MRHGAREPALLLYEELARACAGPCRDGVAVPRGSKERLECARETISWWLRHELASELEWARCVLARLRRLASLAAACVAVAVAAALARAPSEISKGAHWTASSAFSGNPSSGELPRRRLFYATPNYFFHTNADREPWIVIDLGRARVVSSVEIRNRLDCCRERAREIAVELGQGGTAYRRVAQHAKGDTTFRDWEVRLPGVAARFVRVVGTPGECLHLADVRVFGS